MVTANYNRILVSMMTLQMNTNGISSKVVTGCLRGTNWEKDMSRTRRKSVSDLYFVSKTGNFIADHRCSPKIERVRPRDLPCLCIQGSDTYNRRRFRHVAPSLPEQSSTSSTRCSALPCHISRWSSARILQLLPECVLLLRRPSRRSFYVSVLPGVSISPGRQTAQEVYIHPPHASLG